MGRGFRRIARGVAISAALALGLATGPHVLAQSTAPPPTEEPQKPSSSAEAATSDEADSQERRGKRRKRELSRTERVEAILASLRDGRARVGAELFTGYREPAIGVFTGDFTVVSREFTLQADNAVIWLESSEEDDESAFDPYAIDAKGNPTEPAHDSSIVVVDSEDEPVDEEDLGTGFDVPVDRVRAIYAEGDILFTSGNEVVRTDRLVFDLPTRRLIAFNGQLKSVSEIERRGVRKKIPLFMRAEIIRQTGNKIAAERGFVSNCGYGADVFHVRAEEVEVELARQRDDSVGGEPAADVEDGPDETVYRLKRGIASSWGIPFLYIPSFEGTAGGPSGFYFKRARAGHSSQFGAYLETEWGDDIKIGEKGDRTKIGDWTVHIDPYEKRGVGLGLDLDYKAATGYGNFLSYYIHDSADEDRKGRQLDPDTGQRTRIPIDNPDRSRFRLQYRHFFPWDVEGTFEYSWISDPNFLREYYEREFKQGKEQETVAYLKKVVGNNAFTLLQRNRVNDFQEQTEYLPQAEHRLIEQPLLPDLVFGTNVYYSSRSVLGNIRQRPSSEGPPLDDIDRTRITRFDTTHRLSTPFTIGPAVLRPFVESGAASFSETRAEEGPTNRFTAAFGASLSTQIHRTYDAKNELLGIDGLRHIANPIVSYTNRYANTVGSTELIPHDEIEDIDKVEFVRFQLRNRLQTKRRDRVVDFIDFDSAINIFPDEERDNENRTWGDLENDLFVRVTPKTTFFFESEWDFREDDFEVLNTGVSTSPWEGLVFRVSYREFRQRQKFITGLIGMTLNEKWSAQFFQRYDFEREQNQDFGVVFARKGCGFVTEWSITHDGGDNDTRISLNITPSAFYRGPSRKRGAWDDEVYSSFVDLSEDEPLFGEDLDEGEIR